MIKKVLLTAALALVALAGSGAAASAQIPSGVQPFTEVPPQVPPGEQFLVQGRGCPGGGPVTVTINGQTFEVMAGEDGTWSLLVDSPVAEGDYEVVAVCGESQTRNVLAVGGVTQAPQALPRTGDDSSTPVARIGLAAIVAGGALLAVSRRKRASVPTA
jgi:LPXTG-motif cell wall-anchored protein